MQEGRGFPYIGTKTLWAGTANTLCEGVTAAAAPRTGVTDFPLPLTQIDRINFCPLGRSSPGGEHPYFSS